MARRSLGDLWFYVDLDGIVIDEDEDDGQLDPILSFPSHGDPT